MDYAVRSIQQSFSTLLIRVMGISQVLSDEYEGKENYNSFEQSLKVFRVCYAARKRKVLSIKPISQSNKRFLRLIFQHCNP